MNMNDWRDKVHVLAREKGWWRGVSVMMGVTRERLSKEIMMVVTELGEAVQIIRDPDVDPRDLWEDDGKPEGFGIELVDAMIRILSICGELGVDVDAMMEDKHRFNEGRDYRHGGKRL